MRIVVAVVLAAIVAPGCLMEASPEVAAGADSVARSELSPIPNKTVAWRDRTAYVSGSVRITQSRGISLGTFNLNEGGTATAQATQYTAYSLRGPRYALSPAAKGTQQVTISQSWLWDPKQTWSLETTWGMVVYHRPIGTRNAWEQVRCARDGLVSHQREAVFSVFPQHMTFDHGNRAISWDGGPTSVAFADCGIQEEVPEFAVMPIPLSSAGDLGEHELWAEEVAGTRYDFYVEVSCPNSAGGVCPGYSDAARASADFCRADREPWIGASVRRITPAESRLLARGRLEYSNQGFYVTAIAGGSVADLQVGDILLTLAGDALSSLDEFQAPADFANQLATHGPGDHVLGVLRRTTPSSPWSQAEALGLPATVDICPTLY